MHWIEGGVLNTWVLGNAWVWPVLEIFHFIGLSLLIGTMIVVDLRMVGFLRHLSFTATIRLLPLATIGFAINLVTGLLFFFGDPARYVINVGFQIKMILIILAGINVLWFQLRIAPLMTSWAPHGDSIRPARFIAVSSFGLWLCVLLLGRLIPYVGTG